VSDGATRLEICVETVAGALAAERGGADRLELCARPDVGGLTPSPALLAATRAETSLPLVVLVRPRGGDFRSTPGELRRMLAQIDAARDAGAQGVALGVLRGDASVAVDELAALVERARSGRMEVCFHRAFDGVADRGAALEALVALGVDRVLTSGGPPRAADGLAVLRALVEQAAGRVAIMPGGGVRAADARRIASESGCLEIHSSAGMPPGGDAALVRALREALDEE
jgi:copper homeostasis protein